MALFTFDVWKDLDGWQWCNRYHIVSLNAGTAQGSQAGALVDLEKAMLDDRANITRVNVAPVPDPGSAGFVPYPVSATGTLNMSGEPQAPPEVCLWVSLTGISGLLGRKTYRNSLINHQVRGGVQTPRYVGSPLVLAAASGAWSDFLETTDGLENTLRIGVSATHPSGRVVTGYTVRSRPMSVKVNHRWFNRLPAPP